MNILSLSQGVKDKPTNKALRSVETALKSIKQFTPHAEGMAPKSGGGSINFLRADGTWAAPLGVDSSSVTGITNRLPKFTGPTSLGNSSVQDDGTTVSTPELIVANGGFASHASSTVDATAATIPLSINDSHTNQTSAIVELSIDSTGSSFAGATGGGGGVGSSYSGLLPSGGSSTMLVANAVGTVANGSLTNTALFANAQHGTTNYALYSPHGDVFIGAGNSTLTGTLAVTGATQLQSTLNVTLLATLNGGLTADGAIVFNPTSFFTINTALGTPSPPSVDPCAILIQDSTQTSVNDASLIWWNIGSGTPFNYNVYAGAQNTQTSPSSLNPRFVVGVQNHGTTGVGNMTQQFMVTDASAFVAGTLGVGNVTTPAGLVDARINQDATTPVGVVFIGNNFTGQNFASSIGVDSAKTVHFGTSSANTAWRFDNSAGTQVARIDAKAANTTFTVNGTSDFTGNAEFDGTITSLNATASTPRLKLVGKDVLGNTDNTNGPTMILGITTTGRRDVLFIDPAGTSSADSVAIGCGTTQGAYIQGVDQGWSTAKTLFLQKFGGATTIGAGAAITLSGPTTVSDTSAQPFTITDSTQVSERIRLAGQEYHAAANTDTNGPAFLLYLNRSGNRAVSLVDSANETSNSTNPMLMFSVQSGASATYIDSGSIDASTAKTLNINTVLTSPTVFGSGAVSMGGTLQVTSTGSFGGALNMNSHLINNVTDPVSAQDAATKNYVDGRGSFYLGRQTLTAASGTYTPTSGTNKVHLHGCGSGGGGGGGAGGSSVLGAGGGGSSGGWFDKWINPGAAITGGAYTNSTGGTAGSSSGGNGGNGGSATIVIQGTTYTFSGGNGGTGMAAAATLATAAGGGVIGGVSAGDFSTNGMAGLAGIRLSGTVGVGGAGGSSPYGGGGAPTQNGTGFGSGGGGGTGGIIGAAGGTGSASVIIVDEWR